jgi:hypothetical protein
LGEGRITVHKILMNLFNNQYAIDLKIFEAILSKNQDLLIKLKW